MLMMMILMIRFTYAFNERFSTIFFFSFMFHMNFINYSILIELCLLVLLGLLFSFLLQFVANEHKNGLNSVEPKDGVIEPDGPSVVSKEEDDSKVIIY